MITVEAVLATAAFSVVLHMITWDVWHARNPLRVPDSRTLKPGDLVRVCLPMASLGTELAVTDVVIAVTDRAFTLRQDGEHAHSVVSHGIVDSGNCTVYRLR